MAGENAHGQNTTQARKRAHNVRHCNKDGQPSRGGCGAAAALTGGKAGSQASARRGRGRAGAAEGDTEAAALTQ